MDNLRFYAACRQIIRHCPNQYAKAYAKAGLDLTTDDEIRMQALYILCNIGHWRHQDAKVCRKVLNEMGRPA